MKVIRTENQRPDDLNPELVPETTGAQLLLKTELILV